jgi:hypothetical protein
VIPVKSKEYISNSGKDQGASMQGNAYEQVEISGGFRREL